MRAMPPSSYRHMPLRSRKRYNPTRLTDMGGAGSGGANAHDPGTYSEAAAGGPPPSAGFASAPATLRSAGPFAMVNASHGARNEALGSTATRSGMAYGSFLDAILPLFPFHLIGTRRAPGMDAAVAKPSSGDRKSGTNAKDAAAAAAPSSCRLPSRSRKQRRPEHFTSDSEEAAAAARAKAHRSNAALDRFLTSQVGGPGEPDGRARILAIVAILGASLALSAVSCLLFYIAGQQTDPPGPSDSHKKVSVSFL